MINSRFLFLAAFLLAGICIASPASATTCANSSYPAAQLTGMVSGTEIQLNWNAISDPGFQGYKVVISKNSASPRYPDDGYLYFITDSARNSVTVDSTATYNGGDVGDHLQPGVTYSFSVTTLYCDRTVPGNVISLTFPGTLEPVPTTAATPVVTATATPVPTANATPVVTTTATPVPTQSANLAYRAPVVRATADGDHIHMTWNRITDPRFLGYRVVASEFDLAPAYPEDGFLYWITDMNQNYATIDNSTPYHGGDIGFSFQPGVSYSFSVSAVYTDGTVAGNAVRIKYSAKQPTVSPPPGDYPVPVLTGSADSGHVRLAWNPVSDRRLMGYNVVFSKNKFNEQSPNGGDLLLINGRDQTSAMLDTSGYYFGGRVRPGASYYFRVVALYPDRSIPSKAIYLTVPGQVTPVPTQQPANYPVPQVTGTVDGSKVRLTWNVITDSRFQGYKVVISKNNPNPKYPDDGYLSYITDRNQHTVTIDAKSKYNGGDFGGYLVPGQTYYFSITAIYSDRKVAGNSIALVFPGSPLATPTPTPVVTETTTPVPTTTPCTTATPEPTEITPVPTVTTTSPTPVITTEPTLSVYDLIAEQNNKIDAQSRLIAEQNRKLTEQSNVLDRLLAFLRTLFRF